MTEATAVAGYQLIEKPERIYAIDMDGVEICGARRPYGHLHYVCYTTLRVCQEPHQVLATTRECAIRHVRMVAGLWSAAQ